MGVQRGRPRGSNKFVKKLQTKVTLAQSDHVDELRKDAGSSEAGAIRLAIDRSLTLTKLEAEGLLHVRLPRLDMSELESLIEKGLIDSIHQGVVIAVKGFIRDSRGELAERDAERRRVR